MLRQLLLYLLSSSDLCCCCDVSHQPQNNKEVNRLIHCTEKLNNCVFLQKQYPHYRRNCLQFFLLLLSTEEKVKTVWLKTLFISSVYTSYKNSAY